MAKLQIDRILQSDIEERLKRFFRYHIGEDENAMKGEIFQVITGAGWDIVDSLTRYYWWDIIEKLMKKLRREDKVFIIRKKGKYFVLKNQDEANYYKDGLDNSIMNMEKAKVRADAWVEQKKWKEFAQETRNKEKEAKTKAKAKSSKRLLNPIEVKRRK